MIHRKRRLQRALLYILLIIVLAGLVFPVLFMAFTSFKTAGEVNRIPPTLWPRYPTLENYPFMARAWDFWLALRNTLLLAGGSGLGATVLGAMAAYAFSRGTFRGRTLMYGLLVASMAVPAMVTLGPIFIAYLQLNLLDTHIGLILVFTAGGMPLATLLLFAYFNAIPRELDDAAAIDGAGRFTTLFRIIIPIAMPGVFVSFLLLFIAGWKRISLRVHLVDIAGYPGAHDETVYHPATRSRLQLKQSRSCGDRRYVCLAAAGAAADAHAKAAGGRHHLRRCPGIGLVRCCPVILN